MLHKRKRSDSEMSSPSYSMSPSPTQSGAIASAPYMSQFGHEVTPLHLSSRTRKRVRDNRPSEHQIHENTLNLLFSAQKQHQQPEPTYPQAPTMSMSPPPQQQSSLHSFWALPARPTSRDSSANSGTGLSAPAYCQETNCEDCDAVLVNGDGDAMEMDVDVDIFCILSTGEGFVSWLANGTPKSLETSLA
ncbi:hypothetical protein V502_05925 [Pseudogymnoascus sp. VKM F-4520 (FW-2644)]|nr:hypothetical protein V502_05925 [Pseudogymnoascus sp. VKM F-4520 (FW-2644)]